MKGTLIRVLATVLITGWVVGCGSDLSGSTSSPSPAAAPAVAPTAANPADSAATADLGPPSDRPATKAAAARFLSQSSFGPSASEIDGLMNIGYSRWVDQQLAKPAGTPHLDYFAARTAELDYREWPSTDWVYGSFWRTAVTADDQLRHRVAFALSQIFVVSVGDDALDDYPRGVAGFLDMLGRNAFGNFRTLLEDVSLHPMMGLYLTHLGNQKADLAAGRAPDENYAREVMQLFTIGLYELNLDGTVKLDTRNEPIDTYKIEDVVGLARVFTGFSWAGPDSSNSRFFGNVSISDRDILPMRSYPSFHETGTKTFLGTTITTSTPEASLKSALDRLFMHPNVGPFIGRQLIQKLITSNPSPAYVARVATAFNDNGQGVRGDMKAVVRAIMLDVEARNDAAAGTTTAGKVREPVLRLAAWMRAFDTKSTTGHFLIGVTDDPDYSIGQTPMRSPSVFNFFRPGYVPPDAAIAQAKLVSPEMQNTHESSVAGWLNTMRWAVPDGFGNNPPNGPRRDVQPDYTNELALADNATALVDRVALLLTADRMPASVRQQITAAVASVNVALSNPANREAARRNRVHLAVFLTVASPDFIVQK
jgi:uncharacterized protein (DUF1800 family)